MSKLQSALGVACVILCLGMPVTNALAQQERFLPVDGKREFIKGVNLPWFDGAYGHDFGRYQQHPDWDISYTPAKAEVRFADVARMNVKVMRLWVFQSWSGIVFDKDGYASHIDASFLKNIKEAIGIAHRNGIQCYLCVLTDVKDHHEKFCCNKTIPLRNIIIDREARSRFVQNILIPFTEEMIGNPGVFAFDVLNEPEHEVAGRSGNWTDEGYSWNEMRAFLKMCVSVIHRTDKKRLVSVGSGWHDHENVLNGIYSGLGLDFFDYHRYDDKGDLIAVSEIRSNLKRLRVPQRELTLPILIGECGQYSKDKPDDETQRTAVAGFLKNGSALGYAGVLVWSYEWPGVPVKHRGWERLLKGDGDSSWRPAAFEIQKFQ